MSAISAAPDTEMMVDLMRRAVGFAFLTTFKIGGGISGMGGEPTLDTIDPDLFCLHQPNVRL